MSNRKSGVVEEWSNGVLEYWEEWVRIGVMDINDGKAK